MKNTDYLNAKGISGEMCDRFKLGVAIKGGLREHLLNEGFSDEECIESGVATIRNGRVEDFFRNAIIFPIIARGRVVSLTARILDDNVSNKFMHLRGAISWLFNEDILCGADEIIICEGPVDTITAVQHGYKAVGMLGAQAFKKTYLSKFSNVDRVYTCLDNDDAGRRGLKQLGDVFNGNIKVIQLPEGVDLNDYFNAREEKEV